MSKNKYFETREEVLEFLNEYDFKWYVPRLEERKCDAYYVEYNDTKITYCSMLQTERDSIHQSFCFYDNKKAFNMDLETPEEGEERYQRFLEYIELCK